MNIKFVVVSSRIPSCLVLGYQLSGQHTTPIIRFTVTLIMNKKGLCSYG